MPEPPTRRRQLQNTAKRSRAHGLQDRLAMERAASRRSCRISATSPCVSRPGLLRRPPPLGMVARDTPR